MTLSGCVRVRYSQGGTTSHCASEGGKRPSYGATVRCVVSSRETGTPALDAGSALRNLRRKFRHGVRTASRQAACSDRLMRTSFSFSIRSRATLLRWVSNKSRSAPLARAHARTIQVRVYAPTRRQRQGRLIHHHRSSPRDFAHFGV